MGRTIKTSDGQVIKGRRSDFVDHESYVIKRGLFSRLVIYRQNIITDEQTRPGLLSSFVILLTIISLLALALATSLATATGSDGVSGTPATIVKSAFSDWVGWLARISRS